MRGAGAQDPKVRGLEAKGITVRYGRRGVLDGLDLTLSVNGEIRQRDSTANLVFKPTETITELSHFSDVAPGDHIVGLYRPDGAHFLHKEGYREGEWILMDYGDVVAHIFRQEAREYYALEHLWADAALTPYED